MTRRNVLYVQGAAGNNDVCDLCDEKCERRVEMHAGRVLHLHPREPRRGRPKHRVGLTVGLTVICVDCGTKIAAAIGHGDELDCEVRT